MSESKKVLLPKEVAKVLTCLYIAVEPSVANDVRATVEKGFLNYQVLFALESGELSEGQASKILNLDRVSLRLLREEYLTICKQSLENAPVDDTFPPRIENTEVSK